MASLDEPYLVTSYGLTPKSSVTADVLEQIEDYLPQLATTSVIYREGRKGSKTGKQQSRRAVAVNTLQHNGIHLVDLSDQSPLAAFPVSPSTTFTTAALSISQVSGSSNAGVHRASTSASATRVLRTRKTFVGLERDGEVLLCCWKESEAADGSTDGEPEHFSIAVSNPILAIAEHDGTILTFSSFGEVCLYDQNLQEITRSALSSFDGSIGRIQILSRTTLNSTTEQPNRAADTVHQLAVLVAVLPSAKKGAESAVPIQHNGPRRRHHSKKQRASVASMAQHVCYINICHTPRQISESGRVEIPNAAAVADLSDGQFAIITPLGNLETRRLSAASWTSIQSAPYTRDRPLGYSMEMLKTVVLSDTLLDLRHAGLLSPLKQEFGSQKTPNNCVVLVAPQSLPSKIIDLSLWDIKLGLVLARKELELPATITSGSLADLSLVYLTNGLAGLAMTPSSEASDETSSSLAQRVLLHAFAFQTGPSTTLSSIVGKETLTKPYLKVKAGKKAVNELNGAQATASVVDLATYRLVEQMEQHLSLSAARRSVDEATTTFRAWLLQTNEATSKPRPKMQLAQLSAPAVKRIVNLAISTSDRSLPIAEGIVHDLIIHRKINDCVVPEGLTSYLLDRRHWRLVSSCLRSFDDISEGSLIAIITASIEELPQQQSEDSPSFASLLKLVVRAPYSAPILRQCLRKQLDPRDLRPVLEIMDGWLVHELQSAVFDDVIGLKTPGSQQIVPFLQTLFDAHLVAIMQSATLHPLVVALSGHLVQAISLSVTLEGLQAPLSVFSKARTERAQQTKEKARSDGFKSKETRWQEKKALQDTQLLLGDYAVETFQL